MIFPEFYYFLLESILEAELFGTVFHLPDMWRHLQLPTFINGGHNGSQFVGGPQIT